MSPSEPAEASRASGPTGGPAGAELAAIVAAVEMAWPRPVPVTLAEATPSRPWRFSGRWWSGRRPRATTRRRA